jgi:hypothetical protein
MTTCTIGEMDRWLHNMVLIPRSKIYFKFMQLEQDLIEAHLR